MRTDLTEFFRHFFRVKTPCRKCPFRTEGAIELRPGRVQEIIDHLLESDDHSFRCHETVHSAKFGGEWDDDTGTYAPSNNEAHCAGAAIFLQKMQRASIWMRFAHSQGVLDLADFTAQSGNVIDRAPDSAAAGGPDE
ncbi:hypothetical protein R70006_06218 [Paraburkholderia domus]|uniref:hypothetical protein n=1 Tax=Paraburkholderia domus TaxID=2793075 RepID=UPI0019140AF1|nr:hypothetical protein [Paraburkholderia domus]CAE6821443.1 hypothetical protein R70006_06218 [Paraburkholderia domus]